MHMSINGDAKLRDVTKTFRPDITLQEFLELFVELDKDPPHIGYTVKDNYGNEDYVDTPEDAERAAKEWLADEDMDWPDYTVQICKRIKIYTREATE